jgi:hypothetical protein
MKKNDDGFSLWLTKTKRFQPKVVCDILSRKNRLLKIKKFGIGQNVNSYLSKLEEISAFKNLSISVKSQMRRSVRLLSEFHSH